MCVAKLNYNDILDLRYVGINDVMDYFPNNDSDDQWRREIIAEEISDACCCESDLILQLMEESENLLALVNDNRFPGKNKECIVYMENGSPAYGFLHPENHIKIIDSINCNG